MLLRLESQKSEPTSIPMSFVLLDKYESFFLSASPPGSSWSKQKSYPCPMSTGSSWFPFPSTKQTSNIEHVEREARIKIQCHYFDLLLCPKKDRNSQKDYIEVIYWKRYAELIVSLGVPVVVLQERSRYCNIAFKSQLSLDMLYVCWVARKGNRLLHVMIGHEEEFSVVFILELLEIRTRKENDSRLRAQMTLPLKLVLGINSEQHCSMSWRMSSSTFRLIFLPFVPCDQPSCLSWMEDIGDCFLVAPWASNHWRIPPHQGREVCCYPLLEQGVELICDSTSTVSKR